MKKVKKLVSVLLALVMVFAMATTAFAANVTLPNDGILKDHAFTAYQIFSGREENGTLSDVKWGNGIDADGFLTALKAMENSKFTDCETAAAVAKVLSANKDDAGLANAVAKIAYQYKAGNGTKLTAGDNELADGYYLIVDTTENVAEGGAYNAALLQVVGDINVTVKTDAPTLDKKVKEDDKYNNDGGFGNGYNDVADYNIGDEISFKLIGSVPDMSRYETYKYIFHDTLSAGLTLNADSIKVYVADDAKGTNKQEITASAKVAVNGQSFTVAFDDLKTVPGVAEGKYIIVEYTATLNTDAQIGLPGNGNEAYLEYSNNPDQSGKGEDHPTGETPKDEVIVFTYELDTTKVDGESKDPLDGAEFVLYRQNDDVTEYVIVDENGKVAGWTTDKDAASVLKSDENGLFKVIGLDDGTYFLEEVKAPTGYNKLENPIEIVIKAETNNGQTWDGVPADALVKLDVTADGKAGTGDVNTGIAGITVANNKGSELPETGGIGTTIFYIVGSVLVVGAAILLITKKRVTAKN